MGIKKNLLCLAALLGSTYTALDVIARMKKADSIYENEPDQKNSFEGKRVVFISDEKDKENADGIKGHLEAIGEEQENKFFYDQYIKRGIDKTLAFCGLVALSPVLLATAVAINVEDPGPVLFVQKRVGKNKKFFKMHKFRSMRMDTPHDMPTHMLKNPDQYITNVGKFIRAHSIDELPQLWDIFIGNMSVIGPRPALWNQDKLIALRDEYGANSIKPGLTGWAQINGRDELELEDKAKLDGEYVRKRGPMMDAKCFLKSIHVFGKDESVVEGGTGKMNKETKSITDPLDVDTTPTERKRVLITGANSYIGDAVRGYLLEADSNMYEVDILETKGLDSSSELFAGYDVVINVAGIAHIKESDENRHLYYVVNRDLVIKIAEDAKKAGVKQFVLLSSMSVYGVTVGHITKDTEPNPINAYGDSKIQADNAIERLADENFTVTILRPPMVYGKGCKGNYQKLRTFALKSPIFPNYNNNRSMIYIGNLCEFVKRVIDRKMGGLYFPQNARYVSTSDMVRLVASMHNRSIMEPHIFNPIIKIIPLDVFKKVFGDLTYEHVDIVSKYNLEESIELTEGYWKED